MTILAMKRYQAMTRNMDLIKDLLLKIEQEERLDGNTWISYDESDDFGVHSIETVGYHLTLLIEAGFVKGSAGGFEVCPAISRLTWDGHEFLDNIRDPGIWSKTKERLSGLPSVALSVVAEIAKAEAKKHLGLI